MIAERTLQLSPVRRALAGRLCGSTLLVVLALGCSGELAGTGGDQHDESNSPVGRSGKNGESKSEDSKSDDPSGDGDNDGESSNESDGADSEQGDGVGSSPGGGEDEQQGEPGQPNDPSQAPPSATDPDNPTPTESFDPPPSSLEDLEENEAIDVDVVEVDTNPDTVPELEVPQECTVPVDRTVIQRLTRNEYDNTVSYLYGVTDNPARSFPPDSTTGGFDNIADSLTVSPTLTELLLDAAEEIAATALQTRRNQIITCDPSGAGQGQCAQTVMRTQARRAYRRTPTDREVADLVSLVDVALAEGESFDDAIKHGITGMLVSPQFLYRGVPSETPLAVDADGNEILDGFSVASRLSYFLWASTPDDQLLTQAEAGNLTDPANLRAQFARMLNDSRSDALYSSFITRWLALGKLETAAPDPALFPQFDESTRAAMVEEVRLFFTDLRLRDASPLEFITATRTYANDVLADIYGVSAVSGGAHVAVDLDPAQRAGVLTMPAILTMTSNADHTNIVKRGAWMAEMMLCAKPPPPPDGVPPLPDPLPNETERERLDRHRADPVCAPCHNLIDPLGYPFENYGPIGEWRDQVDGVAADTAGAFPDGTQFADMRDMADQLQSRVDFGACLAQRLMTYAVGRVADARERCVIEAMGAQATRADAKFSDVLWAIVTSDAFLKQAPAQ